MTNESSCYHGFSELSQTSRSVAAFRKSRNKVFGIPGKYAKGPAKRELQEPTGKVCFLCRSEFTRPKLLPCFHTFCEICLEHHVRKWSCDGKVECPLCLKQVRVRRNKVQQLEDNKYFEMAERVKCRLKDDCDCCKNNTPVSHCLICDQFYCISCKQAHERMPPSRDHQIIEFSWAKHQCCDKHEKNELNLYCMDCEQCICELCSHTTHKTHVCEEVGKRARVAKAKLLDQITESTISVDKIKTQIRMLDRQENIFDAEIDLKRTELETRIESLKRILDDAYQDAVKDLQLAKSNAKKKLHEERLPLQIKLNACLNVNAFAESFLKVATAPDVVRRCDSLSLALELNAGLQEHWTPPVYFLEDNGNTSNAKQMCKSMVGEIKLLKSSVHNIINLPPPFPFSLFTLKSVDQNILCPVSADECWLINREDICLSLIICNKRGGSRVVSDLDGVNSVVMSSNTDAFGNAYVALKTQVGIINSVFNWKITQLLKSGKLGETFNIKHEESTVLCLSVSNTNKIVILLESNDCLYQLKTYSREGKLIATVEIKGLPSLQRQQFSTNMAFLNDNSICVACTTQQSPVQNRIVNIDNKGNSKISAFKGKAMFCLGKYLYLLQEEGVKKYLYERADSQENLVSMMPAGHRNFNKNYNCFAVHSSGTLWIYNSDERHLEVTSIDIIL